MQMQVTTPNIGNPNRRSFMLGSASFGVALSFGGLSIEELHAQAAAQSSIKPNAWMTLASDGTVVLMSPASEMGQGTMTAMPLIIAEEMDLDWSKCTVIQAPLVPKDFGNPRFGGAQTTGASRTTQGYWDPMRIAGATARQVLINAAAARWGVAATEVTTAPHTCIHAASGRRLSYGEIAAFATVPAELPKVDKAQLKKMADYRLIGKDIARVDLEDKVNGRAQYGIDQRLPGLKYAAVLRTPVQGESPVTIDEVAAKAIPGVSNILRLPYGVAVVASSTWAAMRGKAALKVTWSTTAKARAYDSEKLKAEFTARANNLSDPGVISHTHGDTAAALKGASRVIGGDFVSEHVAHMTLEPQNATAWVREGTIEVWAPVQSASLALLGITSPLVGFKPEQVKVNVTLLGGGYGRRVDFDYVIDAALVAKALPGTPVQVVWDRADDIQRDKLRPLMVQNLQAGLDAQGNLVALQHRMVSESIYARVAPPVFAAAGGKDQPACEGFEINYDIPNHLANYLREQRGIDMGFWRGVGGGYTKFAIETVVDEAARLAGQDPIQYRMRLLAKQPRAQAVLREVAAMAKWDGGLKRGNRALGFAYSDMWNTHIGMIVDVETSGTTIKVHNIWAAVDCGIALMPGNVAKQIEGSAVFGLSGCLKEKLTIKDGVFQATNFHDYLVLRGNECPPVTVKVMMTDNHPGGIGEVGLPPVAPAIANAIASITNKRLRSLPLSLA